MKKIITILALITVSCSQEDGTKNRLTRHSLKPLEITDSVYSGDSSMVKFKAVDYYGHTVTGFVSKGWTGNKIAIIKN